MELAKAAGIQFLRIHIKADEPRRLYWADKLGMLIMQDMPSASFQNPDKRSAWEETMRATIARDRNHPSIFAWVAFNETWGLSYFHNSKPLYPQNPDTQQWVEGVWKEMKELDPSRLVEDNSADKRDHVGIGHQLLAFLYRQLRTRQGQYRKCGVKDISRLGI